MLFTNEKHNAGACYGDYIQLTVSGYEFPNAGPSPTEFNYDANWLVLSCTKSISNKKLTGAEPCLLTSDVGLLLGKLSQYQKGLLSELHFGGLEPNFSLHLRRKAEGHELQIFFWAEREGEPYDVENTFCKIIDDAELSTMTEFWLNAKERFPVRP